MIIQGPQRLQHPHGAQGDQAKASVHHTELGPGPTIVETILGLSTVGDGYLSSTCQAETSWRKLIFEPSINFQVFPLAVSWLRRVAISGWASQIYTPSPFMKKTHMYIYIYNLKFKNRFKLENPHTSTEKNPLNSQTQMVRLVKAILKKAFPLPS